MLDISISSYGNKGNKQFHIRKKPINRNFTQPTKVRRYFSKSDLYIVRGEYLKATGNRSLLAEDYYIW